MASLITAHEANVLEQLARREKYGLELVNDSGGVLTKNSVYVLLTRMRDKNFITARKVSTPRGESGPPRGVYRLTALGKKVLAAQRLTERTLGEK
jgi:DNA-binding PadR family transcriptional regulator